MKRDAHRESGRCDTAEAYDDAAPQARARQTAWTRRRMSAGKLTDLQEGSKMRKNYWTKMQNEVKNERKKVKKGGKREERRCLRNEGWSY